MKKIIGLVALFISAITHHGIAQDTTVKAQPEAILHAYYKVKDALVSSNATLTAENAGVLVSTINATPKEILADNARASLLKEAAAISQLKDIKQQREKFATLSNNMADLANTIKLSTAPVYQQYCPMKKASWLSSDKAIKNPYYGSAMLTCGTIKATF